MPRQSFAPRMSLFAAAIAIVSATSATAQLAPARTWPELKEAVQQRADRNAYPMTGMKADDVREILGNINSLDRDEWAAAWSRMGARYAERAEAFLKAGLGALCLDMPG